MDKKLPKVFANKIDKPLKNNETIYYDHREKKEEPVKINSTLSLNQKMEKIISICATGRKSNY